MKPFLYPLLTVAYQNAPQVLANIEHTRRLHPQDTVQWWIMDNTPPEKPNGLMDKYNAGDLPENVRVFQGPLASDCPAPMGHAYAAASYHHAAALNQLVKIVQQAQFQQEHLPEPYLTIIDPDFYLLRHHLLAEVYQQMQDQHLAALGTPWNPVYPLKPRGLPCVHFLTLDIRQIPLEQLDFRPAYPETATDKIYARRLAQQQAGGSVRPLRLLRKLDRWLGGRWLGERRSIGSSLDTGSRMALEWAEKQLAVELLTPVFLPADLPARYRTWIEKLWDKLLPEALCYVPRPARYCEQATFRIENAETFVWAKPGQAADRFGVHLRSFQRTRGAHPETTVALLAQLADWSELEI